MKKLFVLFAFLAIQALSIQPISAASISGNYIFKEGDEQAIVSIKDAGNDLFSIETQYVNQASLRTCEYEGKCKLQNNKLVCISEMDDNSYDNRIEFSLQKNGLKLEYFQTSACNTGIPDGIYKKVRK